MNHQDIIDLLTVIAAVDHRTVGQSDVIAWHDLIGDLDRDLAMRTTRDHYREEPGVYLEPGHIYQRVRAIRRDQLEREDEAERQAREDAYDAALAERNKARLRQICTSIGTAGSIPDAHQDVIDARIAEHVQATKTIPDKRRQNGTA